MDRIAHVPTEHASNHNRSTLRLIATAALATAVLAIALLPSNLRDVPTASAYHATHYDLCTRTPEVTDVILTELRAWGAAQTPTPSTVYDAASGFGCASGQTAVISATDLLAHTDWPDNAGKMILGSSVTSLKAGDFAGLNLLYIQFLWTNITEIPARLFEGTTVAMEDVDFTHNAQLAKIHPDAFEGLQVADNRFVFRIYGASKLTHERDSIPPKVFDPIGDQGFDNTAANIQYFEFGGPNISHINTRWFASFAKLGTAGWEAIQLSPSTWNNPNNIGGRGIIDTYYYDDGDGRYEDGTKATAGEVSVLSTTTKATLGAAISAEIARYANLKPGVSVTVAAAAQLADATTIRNFAQGADNAAPLQVLRTNWGSVDICARTPAVRDRILTELRTERPLIYGTAADHTSGSYSVTAGFGCTGNTESAIVTKANLTTHTNWNTDTLGLNFNNAGLTSMRFDDLRYLDADYITFGNNNIAELPDGVFHGLDLKTLRLNRVGLTKIQSRLFEGLGAGADLEILGIADNPKLSDVNIAHDAFDELGAMVHFLDLNDSAIGRVNARWFERLTEIGNGAGWYRIDLAGNPVVWYYYLDGKGGMYDPAATVFSYDPDLTADRNNLRTYIKGKITDYAATDPMITDNADLTGSKLGAPDEYGIDPCGRNTAVWKELMRQFYHIDDVIVQEIAPNAQHTPSLPIGDIRHDRYANISQSECHVLSAQWVNPDTGAPVPDQSTPGASAELAIKNDASFGQHTSNFQLRGSDLSGLTPADLANMHAVERLSMNNTNLENVSANLFADMPKLTHLSLNNNKIKTADLSGSTNFLSPLDNLVQLHIANNLLTEFDADWFTDSAKDSMRDLAIGQNPIATMDLSGLNLTTLYIDNTSIIELDPAITAMTNLRSFWWWGLRAMPIDGFEDFVNGLPSGLVRSIPHDQFGNPGDQEDAELDQATLAFTLAHTAKMAEINRAGGGDQVTYMQLADPCRPTILTGTRADWETDFGDLCLTAAQKDAFISSIDGFDAAFHWILKNSDLSDAQMATMLAKLAAQDNVYGIQFNGNPEAFGAGFNDSALSAFSEFDDLWMLRLRNHDLNYAQANTILRNLETALASDAYSYSYYGNTVEARGGLTWLDFSYNPNLFKTPDSTDPTMMVDVDPTDDTLDLDNFLRGVFSSNENAGLSLNLQGTDLNFDQLRALIWGIENGISNRQNPSSDIVTFRNMILRDNPNLWKRDVGGTMTYVSAAEIIDLLDDMKGVTGVLIGNTGIESKTIATAVFDGLNAAPDMNKRVDPRNTSTLERLINFGLRGNDLSAITAAELQTEFAKFATRNDLQSPQLEAIGLGGTGINLAQLTGIIDGLDSADLLDGVFALDLANNEDLFESCEASTFQAQLRRFTNLRHLDIQDSDLSFDELECAVNGLTPANTVSINARDNENLWKRTNADGDDVNVPDAEVGDLIGPFTYTRTNFVNTGLTSTQATAIATERAENAQSDEERREIERRTAAQNPSSFAFKTPLPTEIDLQSGRGSLRVAFTHDPMHDGSSFRVLRYEYRYRVRPTDATDAWTDTGTQAWRTASVGSLTETGRKTFDIFGLQTETIYQVQLRATSIARPNTLTLTGGTIINLPEINSIKPAITEVNMRAGEQVRLEVNIYGLANILNNDLYDPTDTNKKLVFRWTDDPGGGSFADPNDARRVTYTAPGLPGTYEVMAEAQPLGICSKHHETNFGVSDAHREDCQATITVRVSRAPTPAEPPADPVNPAGPIPSSLTDSEGIAYTVFTPVDGGTFTSDDITVSAAKGAIPDRQLVGVSATVSAAQAPVPTPGARMTIAGSLYDINAVGADSQAVSGFTLDEPLQACLPLPEAFRANISDVVIVERKTDGSYGILSSKLRQTGGDLSVCGGVSTLPTTIGVAKLGIVPQPPEPPVTEGPEPPETGAPAPSTTTTAATLALGTLLLAATAAAALSTRRRRRSPVRTKHAEPA